MLPVTTGTMTRKAFMPIAPALPSTFEHLAAYLSACGGSDRFEFHDFRGDPDPLAARDFAEELRNRFHDHLGVELEVKQVAHRVTVTVIERRLLPA